MDHSESIRCASGIRRGGCFGPSTPRSSCPSSAGSSSRTTAAPPPSRVPGRGARRPAVRPQRRPTRRPRYPNSPGDYLDDWAADRGRLAAPLLPARRRRGALRRDAGLREGVRLGDEPRAAGPFVGTESRLHTVVELLRQIVHGTETDPQARLAELHRRRDEIDARSPRSRRARSTPRRRPRSRPLPAVRGHRARAAVRLPRGRGELPQPRPGGARADRRLGRQQGRPARRAGRQPLRYRRLRPGPQLPGVLRLPALGDAPGRAVRPAGHVPAVEAVDADRRLRTIHHDWSEAAERTQQTVRQISEQLRRFLDDQVWLENRRVLDLVRAVEAAALACRDATPAFGLEVDEPGHRDRPAVRAPALRRPPGGRGRQPARPGHRRRGRRRPSSSPRRSSTRRGWPTTSAPSVPERGVGPASATSSRCTRSSRARPRSSATSP